MKGGLSKMKIVRQALNALKSHRFTNSSRSLLIPSSSSSSSSPFRIFRRYCPFDFRPTYLGSPFLGQRRTMFIQTQPTPNPASFMFHPGKPVMEVGSSDFPNARTAMNSPLVRSLFAIDGVTRVFFGSDFVTVTKSDEISWDILKPEILAAIMDFYTSGQPLFLDESTAASKDTSIHEDDSEIVAMIRSYWRQGYDLQCRTMVVISCIKDLIWKVELSNYKCREHAVAVPVHLSL